MASVLAGAYFQTHSAGWLFLIAVAAFCGMESIQFMRQRAWRTGRTLAGPKSFWAAVFAWAVIATLGIHRAPRSIPAASLGHGPTPFLVGMCLLVAGYALRWWSFATLGSRFTFNVRTTPDQPITTTGPYRLVRHPGYTGGLMAVSGIGVVYSNWVGLASIALPALLVTLWRIRIEEAALTTAAGPAYKAYATSHKRLIPLIW